MTTFQPARCTDTSVPGCQTRPRDLFADPFRAELAATPQPIAFQAAVEHKRRRTTHRVQEELHRGPDTLSGRPAARRAAGCADGAEQVEQMCPLGLIQLQCVRDPVGDDLGDARGAAALELGVVLGRDACEEGDLLAAQARDPPAGSAVAGQSGQLGADPAAPLDGAPWPWLRGGVRKVPPSALGSCYTTPTAGHWNE
jgi:hypothetical protein